MNGIPTATDLASGRVLSAYPSGTVLSKREFPLRVNFGGNPAVEHTERSWQFYRLKRGYAGIEYETWAGFQLSERQLEYNRGTAVQQR